MSIRKEAYHRWLSNERDALYWERLTSRMETMDGRLTLASGIFSSAAFVSLLTGTSSDLGWPTWLKGVLVGGFSILGAALTFYGRHKSYGKKGAKYSMLHGMCLQQIESWKGIRDLVQNDREVSDDLLREIRGRDAFLQAHEAGHTVDEPLALACENRVRDLERSYRTTYLSGGNS